MVAQQPGSATALGLVPTTTSLTRASLVDEQTVERKASRLYRMKRSVLTTARLITEQAPAGWKCAMLTLTYRDGGDWRPDHVSRCVAAIRSYLGRKGFGLAYVWVAELQQRGAIHYHLLLWLPKGVTLPKPDKRGWWPHGFTKIEWARAVVGYLAKYASKGTDGAFPKGARLSGNGGLQQLRRILRRWLLAPRWVRDAVPIEGTHLRRVKAGWLVVATGELLRSPWKLVARAADWSVMVFARTPA